ncbi:hypothetical protein SAMN05428939_1661 [Streptomyces sp. TLI_105]|nr:hypothetical protein SAMN05428939_1661 [Streptomyces sp. TLI_105]
MERLLSSGHGEAMDALNEHWTKVEGKHLKDMVSAARTIADALDLAAGAIEAMKWKAVAELGVLAGQTGPALALIPVTGGLSALLGAGAIAFTKKQLLKLVTAAMEEAVGHVVSVMTEPVVAALENMAADLVVQVSMDALGVQNGVNLGRTKQAGKDGFDEGVQGAKEGLNLASAGGGGGGGGGGKGKGFHIERDEHEQAGTKLNGVSAGIHGRTAGKLSKAKGHQRRNKGRDDIADALDPVIEKAMGALVKSARTMGDHIGETLPKAVKQISKDHKNNDDAIRDRLARERKDDHETGNGSGGGAGGRNPGGGDGGTPPGGGSGHNNGGSGNNPGGKPISPQPPSNPYPEGKHRLKTACAGTLLHDGTLTAHSSSYHRRLHGVHPSGAQTDPGPGGGGHGGGRPESGQRPREMRGSLAHIRPIAPHGSERDRHRHTGGRTEGHGRVPRLFGSDRQRAPRRRSVAARGVQTALPIL